MYAFRLSNPFVPFHSSYYSFCHTNFAPKAVHEKIIKIEKKVYFIKILEKYIDKMQKFNI